MGVFAYCGLLRLTAAYHESDSVIAHFKGPVGQERKKSLLGRYIKLVP